LAGFVGLAVGVIFFLYQFADPKAFAIWALTIIIAMLVTFGKDLLPKDIYSSKEWNAWWSTPGRPSSAAAVGS